MTQSTIPKESIAWLQRGEQFAKQPAESIHVGFDWTADLARARGEIRTSTWSVENANPNLVTCAMRTENETFDRHRTQAVIVGGVAGHLYKVTNSIETTGGARVDRAVIVVVPVSSAEATC